MVAFSSSAPSSTLYDYSVFSVAPRTFVPRNGLEHAACFVDGTSSRLSSLTDITVLN